MKVIVSQVLRIRVEGKAHQFTTAKRFLAANRIGQFDYEHHRCIEDKSFTIDVNKVTSRLEVPISEPMKLAGGLTLFDISRAVDESSKRMENYTPEQRKALGEAARDKIAEGFTPEVKAAKIREAKLLIARGNNMLRNLKEYEKFVAKRRKGKK